LITETCQSWLLQSPYSLIAIAQSTEIW